MSRSPINGDVIAFCGKGMENLTSIDAGRLRIHIGSKPKARGVREESEGGQRGVRGGSKGLRRVKDSQRGVREESGCSSLPGCALYECKPFVLPFSKRVELMNFLFYAFIPQRTKIYK